MLYWNERFVSLSTSMYRSTFFLLKAVCSSLKLCRQSTSVRASIFTFAIGSAPGYTELMIWQYTTPFARSSTFWNAGLNDDWIQAVSSLRPTK